MLGHTWAITQVRPLPAECSDILLVLSAVFAHALLLCHSLAFLHAPIHTPMSHNNTDTLLPNNTDTLLYSAAAGLTCSCCDAVTHTSAAAL
jgi:hypothetical protein